MISYTSSNHSRASTLPRGTTRTLRPILTPTAPRVFKPWPMGLPWKWRQSGSAASGTNEKNERNKTEPDRFRTSALRWAIRGMVSRPGLRATQTFTSGTEMACLDPPCPWDKRLDGLLFGKEAFHCQHCPSI